MFGWKLLGALRQEKASWEIYTNNNKGMEKSAQQGKGFLSKEKRPGQRVLCLQHRAAPTAVSITPARGDAVL